MERHIQKLMGISGLLAMASECYESNVKYQQEALAFIAEEVLSVVDELEKINKKMI